MADAYLRLAIDSGMNGYPREWVKLPETAHLLDPLSSEIIDELSTAYFYLVMEKKALDFWESNRKFAPYTVSRSIVNYYISKEDFGAADKEVKVLEALAPDESSTIVAPWNPICRDG